MKTQQEFEAEIDGDFDQERGDYYFFQVAPHCRSYDATVPIVGDVFDAFEVQETLSDWVQSHLRIDLAEAEIDIDPLERSRVGYGNLYRGIKRMAQFIGDCRFFIAEVSSSWVDDYTIRDQVLSFRRFYAPVDEPAQYRYGREAQMAHLIRHAQAGDDELRVVMAEHFGAEAEDCLNKVTGSDQQEDLDEAQAELDRSMAIQPPTLFVQLQIGRLHLLRDEFSEAAACFAQAQTAKNSDTAADAVLHLAALTATNNIKRATDFTAQLEQINDYEALLLLATIHRATDRTRATNYVNTLVTSPDQEHKARSTILSSAMLEAINDLITDANSMPEQKAEFLSKVVHGLEDHLRKLPAVYLEIADGLLKKALTMKPSAAVWYQRGKLHRRHCPDEAKGKQQALACSKEAVLYGEHREALLQLAEHHRESNQHSDAQGFYHRYFSASQQAKSKGYGFNIYLWHGLFSYADCMLAQLEQRDGAQFATLLDHARFALDAFVPWFEPASPIVLIADLLSFEQRYEEAAVLYDLAVAQEPSCVQALSHKASGYCNLKEFDEANRVLDEAVAIDPTYWHIHYMRACITSLQGDIDDAFAHLNKAFVTIPDNCKAIVTQENDLAALRSDDRYNELMDD